MMTRRRIAKWSAGFLGVSILLIVTALVSLFYLLRSGQITQHALPQLKNFLSPLGVEIEKLGSARIDLFSSVKIDDLALRWYDNQQGIVNLTLAEADIAYDAMGLMDDQLTLSKLYLNNIHLQAELILPPSESETGADKSSAAPWTALQEALNAPQLAFILADNIEINNLSLDITLIQPPLRIRYQGTLENFSLNALWQPDALTGKLALKLSHADDEQLVIIETIDEQVTSHIKFRPTLESKLSWQFEQHDQQWQFTSSLNNEISLTDLSIGQNIDGQLDKIRTDKLKLSLKHTNKGTIGEQIEFDNNIKADLAAVHFLQHSNNTEAKNTLLKLTPTITFDSQGKLQREGPDWQFKHKLKSNIELDSLNIKDQLGDALSDINTEQLNVTLSSQQQGLLDKTIRFDLQLALALATTHINQQISQNGQTHISLRPELSLNSTGTATFTEQQQWQFDTTIENSTTLSQLDLKRVLDGEQVRFTTEQLQFKLISKNTNMVDQSLDFMFNLSGDAQPIVFEQVAVDGSSMQASFSPRFSFDHKGDIADFSQLIENESLDLLTLQARHQIDLDKLQLTQTVEGKLQQYRIDQPSFSFDTQLSNKKIINISQFELENIKVPEFQTPISITTTMNFASNIDLRQSKFELHSQLNQQDLARIKINSQNQANNLSLKHEIQAQLPDSLPKEWRNHPNLQKLLAQLGNPNITLSGNSVFDANFDELSRWPITAQGQFKLVQTELPLSDEGIYLAQPLNIAYQISHEQNQHQLILNVDAPSLQTPPLLMPMPLSFSLDSRADWPLTQATAKGQLLINNRQALAYDVTILDQAKRFKINSHFTALAAPEWQRYLAALKELAPVGEVTSEWVVDGEVEHEFDQLSSQEITPQWLMEKVTAFTISTKISQSKNQRGTDIHFFDPIELEQKINLANKQLTLRSRFTMPDAQLPAFLNIKGLNGQIDIVTPASETPNKVQLKLQLKPAVLELHQQDPDSQKTATLLSIGALATPFDLALKAHRTETDFTLDELSLSSGTDFLTFNAIAQGDLEGNNGQMESMLEIKLDHRFSDKLEYSVQGKIELPLQISSIDAKQLSVEGDMKFTQFNLTLGTNSVKGLDGQLRIEEELLWDGETLGFRYLIPADPFQRVDYSRVQPYLNSDTLRFDSVISGNLEAGPGLAGISLKQNLFRLQPFDLDLFGGHISGQLYFDATPKAWQFGFLSRMNDVDLRQLLPADSPLQGDELSPVSARTAITFDIQQRLMEGQIDVTKINRAQLLQMLEIIDPDYEDPQLATVRSALRLAYPQWIKINMQSGLMNLQIKVSALPTPINVRNLPLTPLINHFGEETFTEMNAIPLK
jgi:hypothetical protein